MVVVMSPCRTAPLFCRPFEDIRDEAGIVAASRELESFAEGSLSVCLEDQPGRHSRNPVLDVLGDKDKLLSVLRDRLKDIRVGKSLDMKLAQDNLPAPGVITDYV